MRIIFISHPPKNITKPFAIYKYDEVLAGDPSYIDIRKIIKNRGNEWLDEINESFVQLSSKFVRHTRWWWVTGMSRLDARPWVQEHLFKPLFFARAVLEWCSLNQGVKEVYLAGCSHEVAMYLKEFKKDLVVDEEARWIFPSFFIFFLFKHVLVAILKLFKNVAHVLRHHLFRKRVFIKSDVLVLYESVANASLTSGYKFYYDGLFDGASIAQNNSIVYGCIDSVFSPVKELRRETDDKVFFVLDHISFFGFAKSIFLNIYLIFLTVRISLNKNLCKCEGYQSSRFWPNYLISELSRTFFLSQICSYNALNNIFKQHKYRCVVSTYEEKIIERAVLFSCQEAGIPVIGYIPHPQHSLALALRDVYKPHAPKPGRYAVCGPRYIDYFLSWGKKKPGSITVWGSKKSSTHHFKMKQLSRNNLKVLLLISHPNELCIFYSWLCLEQRLTSGIRYFLRIYKAANCRKFLEELKIITDRFDFVEEVGGDLKDNVDLCDLAGFCATSAGLLVVNYGLISIHLGLDDFFEINPCFNDVNAMLSCSSAKQFADRIDVLCGLDAHGLSGAYQEELNFVNQVFSPVQEQNIKREIMGIDGNSSVLCASVAE